MVSRFRPLCSVVVLLLSCGAGVAQDARRDGEGESRDEAGPAGPVAPPQVLPARPFDIWYLWGDDGRPVVIPDRVRVREYLEWLTRQQKNQTDPALWSVTGIACDGRVEDDRLRLTVTMTIELVNDDWLLVPVQMVEATLREAPRHKGPGEAIPAPYHPEAGYAWWLRGKGTHELTHAATIPLRKLTPGRRVQLSLPPTAVSSLNLRVPNQRIVARSADKSIVTVRQEGNDAAIDAIGLGTRLDLSWQDIPETSVAETVMEVVTSVAVTVTEGSLATFEATQRVQAQQGTLEELRVGLPHGAELLRLDGAEYASHRIDPANPQQVIVKLRRATAGPIELKYTVRTRLAPGEPFVIEGFDLDNARLQTGYLTISVIGDYRLIETPDENRRIQRINLADLPPPLRQLRVTSAYRFVHALHLTLLLKSVVPYVTAIPRFELHVDALEMELTARYALRILRGNVSALPLRWPRWRTAGWAIEALESPGAGEPALSDEMADDALRIEFPEPVHGQVELTLRARRPLGETQLAELALPFTETAGTTSAILTVAALDPVEVALSTSSGVALREQAVARSPSQNRDDRLRRDYRIESSDPVVQARVTVHPREVRTTTTVAATQQPGAVAVHQRIAYDVAYATLDETTLVLPAGIEAGQVSIRDPQGTLLEFVPSDAGDRAIRVAFDRPQRGRFEIEVRFAIEPQEAGAGSSDQALVIPLVRSADAPFDSTRFQWRDAAGRDAVVREEGWTRELDPEGVWQWSSDRPATEIRIALSRGAGRWRSRAITRALVRAVVSADSTVRTRAEYRLSGTVQEIVFSLPPGVQPVAAWWNRREVSLPTGTPDLSGGVHYRLVTDRPGGAEPLLTIETLAQQTARSRLSQLDLLAAPAFVDDIPVMECLWQIALPSDQHVFTEPTGFASENDWHQWGPMRVRLPRRSDAMLDSWIGSLVPQAPRDDRANLYLYSRAGAADQLAVRTMSRSTIVLIGAGAALVFGLVLVKWPRARHVLTFITLAFVVALLAVWYPGPVLVLLQPAILGLLLALLAAVIDSRVNRRRRPRGIAVAAPGEHASSTSSIARAAPAIGSNEHTAARTPASSPGSAPRQPQLTESGIKS